MPAGIQLGAGVRTSAVYRISSQGDLKQTSNPYDIAIKGAGFFRVQMPDGTDAYTRAGSFGLSPNGQIVTDKGYTVAPGIAVPSNAISVTINAQGQVQATVPGPDRAADARPARTGALSQRSRAQRAGRQSVHRNPGLRVRRNRAFPARPATARVQQGYLETANVNPVEEITALISAQRAYEMNSKVISAADTMMQTTARLGG